MSASILGDFETHANEIYPLALLKHLLKQMMAQFGAHGACIALYDDLLGQMRIEAHIRQRSIYKPKLHPSPGPDNLRILKRRPSLHLENDKVSTSTRPLNTSQLEDNIDDIPLQQSEFLAVGTTFSCGQDLIGYIWQKNEAYVMRHEDYLTHIHMGAPLPWQTDVVPTSYLVVPIQGSTLLDKMQGRTCHPEVLGVIVLYQLSSDSGGFHQKQSAEAIQYVESITLYLQNDKLQRSQQRTSEYLRRLQEISAAFPTAVKLSSLVESIYQFSCQVVDVSSILLTLYDRDVERIYDVLAINDGVRVAGLTEQPVGILKSERPTWWRVTQKEKQTLLFSPIQDLPKANAYRELLLGAWGDQRQAESFLLLPMKMFNRVIGSLCLCSMHPNAYHREEIQVLETMVQIVTVSIENAKLYERDRLLLLEAKQREAEMAEINSALQSISSVMVIGELLNSLVKSATAVVKVDTCVFFQLSPTQDELIAQALHAPSNVRMVDDGSGLPEVTPPRNQEEHDLLIREIRLPFKDTFLEQKVHEGFFYLEPPQLEVLAQKSEGCKIFLQETQIQRMLMITMSYQGEFVGILAVPMPNDSRFPKNVGSLLAICAQATSAIRNAQLFAQLEEANAELERMNKLKDEFLVTASHELRTPLSAISGYSSLLKRQSSRATPQQILRFATKIAGAAQQLNDLVANMTEAAKMGAVDKNLDLQAEPIHVLSAGEIAVSMLTVNIEQVLAVDIAPDLWVLGDAPRFRQVLTNLLDNAAKYSPARSYIRLSARAMKLAQLENLLSEDQKDHELLLGEADLPIVLMQVQDQGEGILPEDQQRIFEKFVRAPRSLTTPVRGSGLGLYICRRLIEAMGGKLWLEQSIPNEGSTFSFYLPRVAAPIEAEE